MDYRLKPATVNFGAGQRKAKVRISAVNRTARAGEDYKRISGTLVFAEGERSNPSPTGRW